MVFINFLKGQQVFWHSSAHVLGEAMERIYGGYLCYGPPIENGFYYDMFMCNECYPKEENERSEESEGNNLATVSKLHFESIETLIKKICQENQVFERLELSKQELLEMFAYNQFKVRILNEKVKEDRTTVYRCGTLIDLCRGPHVRHTGFVKALKVVKVIFLIFIF